MSQPSKSDAGKNADPMRSQGTLCDGAAGTGDATDLQRVLAQIGQNCLREIGAGGNHFFMFARDAVRGVLCVVAEGGMPLSRSFIGFTVPLDPAHTRSLQAEAFLHGKPVVCYNVRRAPEAKAYLEMLLTTMSQVSVPMVYGGETVGVVDVQSMAEDAFSEYLGVDIIQSHASQAAAAIRMDEELEVYVRQLSALREINAKIVSEPSPRNVLRGIVDQAAKVMGSEDRRVFYVQLLDDSGDKLVIQACAGLDSLLSAYRGRESRKGENDAGWPVLLTKASRFTADATADPHYVALGSMIRSSISAPIVFQGEPLGVLGVESLLRGDFTQRDLRFIEALAYSAGAAIKIARSTERLVSTQRQIRQASLYDGVRVGIHDIRSATAVSSGDTSSGHKFRGHNKGF